MARSLDARLTRLEERILAPAALSFVGRVIVDEGDTSEETDRRIEEARKAAGFGPGPLIARVIVTPGKTRFEGPGNAR